MSSKMSKTQVHNYADPEQEWDIAVKCQWLHHCSEHCQQLRNVFHKSVITGFPLGLYCQLFYLTVTSHPPYLHPVPSSSRMNNNNFPCFISAVFCTLAFCWPPPDSLFLLTSWHFLGFEFSSQYRAQCGNRDMSCASENFTDHFKEQPVDTHSSVH